VRLLWQGWTEYVQRAARYQSAVFLNVLYFGVLGPSVVLARLFGVRLLDLDTRTRATYWQRRKPTAKTLDDLARHF
jgi:hypothetical protein